MRSDKRVGADRWESELLDSQMVTESELIAAQPLPHTPTHPHTQTHIHTLVLPNNTKLQLSEVCLSGFFGTFLYF